MRRTYTGWIARDIDGDLSLGLKKPILNSGIWRNFGEHMILNKHASDFSEVSYKNSPVKVTITIEEADEKYKEEYYVDGRLSQVIADLPCIIGTCKGFLNQHYYIFQYQGFTTLVKEDDVIARKENGHWVVLSGSRE